MAVIIPVLNEEESIRGVVADILSNVKKLGIVAEIIVVNDGSTDGTAAAVERLPCTLLNLPFNLGKGAAEQLGIRYAYLHGIDYVVQMDGDGQHPVEDIGRLLQPVREGISDVVIGSRFLAGAGQGMGGEREAAGRPGSRSTFGRRLGIRYFNALQGLLVGRRITDSTSGFRAMNRRGIAICSVEYPDKYPEPEAIVIFAQCNLRVSEIPVRMHERSGGHSSIRMSGSLLYMFKVTLAMLMAVLRTHP